MHEFVTPAESPGAPGGDGGVSETLQDQPRRPQKTDPGHGQTGGPVQPHSDAAEELPAEGRLRLKVTEHKSQTQRESRS